MPESDLTSLLDVALDEARAGLAEGGIPIGAALFAADGTLLGRILMPARVSNLCFGGSPQRNRLFIGVSHALHAVFLNRRGAGWP